jgi:hypothetical protein
VPDGARIRAVIRSPYTPFLVVYLLLRTLGFVFIPVTRYLDSQSWLTLDFSGSGIRLWTVPLFFKVLPGDTLREIGQVALSAFCWIALAAVVARFLENGRLKVIGFATILALGLVVQVTNWDTTILGESVAISLTVGAIAAWWLFVMEPSRWTAALVCIVIVLWAFLRHTNVVLTVLIALLVAVSLLFARNRGLKAAVLVVLAITLAWGLPTFGKNPFNRDEVLITIVSERILTSRSRTDWFADHGMPATRDVRRLAGSWNRPPGGSTAIRQNEKLFHWIQTRGQSVYFEYLLTHPGYLIGEPAKQAISSVSYGSARGEGVLVGAVYGQIRPVLPGPVEDLLFDGGGELMLLAVGVAVLAAAAFGRRGWTRRELVPGVAVLLSIALYIETFHGVATELGRHYMLAAVAIRVSLLVFALLAIDRLLVRRTTTAPEPAHEFPDEASATRS